MEDSELKEYLKIVQKNEVVCKEGEKSNELYIIVKGKLLVCVRKGTEVTPLEHLTNGDYLGELSFFDNIPRSADVIALENTTLIKIPQDILRKQCPGWLLVIAKSLSKKIRLSDQLIQNHGLKRKNVKSIQALDIETQREILKALDVG
ncbi:MAG: cyclic nucleotide-binding domain-containing protein [Bacteriovoracaceae bacterium]|nr:cyclic nucleotide-binding domain-containing protein [Bacteriovoracaceae bacterium]